MPDNRQIKANLQIPQHLKRQERGSRGGIACSVNRDCPKGTSCRPTGHGCCNHAPKRCS